MIADLIARARKAGVDAELCAWVKDVVIFARTMPEPKLRINALSNHGLRAIFGVHLLSSVLMIRVAIPFERLQTKVALHLAQDENETLFPQTDRRSRLDG